MTVYAYTRVSTVNQAEEGNSLEAQVRQVMGYASSRGLDLLEEHVFVEKGVSGGLEFHRRPEGLRLLMALEMSDIVVFPKLDRGFRNTRDALNVLHDLKERGVSVHSIDLGGDVTGNGVGAIIFTILSAFATFERERIASRISEVKQLRKSQGYYVGGRAPFGYVKVDGRKAVDPDLQPIIQQMRDKRKEGLTLMAIKGWLEQTFGIRLGYSTIRQIVL